MPEAMRGSTKCAGALVASLFIWSATVGSVDGPALVAAKPSAAYDPARPESCRSRHVRQAAVCTTGTCRQRADDGLDICEATGFWPE